MWSAVLGNTCQHQLPLSSLILAFPDGKLSLSVAYIDFSILMKVDLLPALHFYSQSC